MATKGPSLAVSDEGLLCPHLLVLASSGSGKTTSLVRPNILMHSGTSLVLDVKGEILAADGAALAAEGREVLVFDPEDGVRELPAGCRKTGLDLISGWQLAGGDWSFRFTQALADLVFAEQSSEPAFAGAVRTLGLAALAASIAPGREKQGRFFERLAGIVRQSPRQLQALFSSHDDDCSPDLATLIAGGGTFLSSGGEGLVQAGIAGMHRQLEFIQGRQTIAAFDGNWRFHELLDPASNATLFIVLPASRLPRYAAALRIIFGSLGAIAEQRLPDAPAANLLAAIDEAAALGRADWLLHGAALHRSYGITYMSVFQSCPQIERIYGKTGVAEFMGNSATVFLGVRDFATAEVLSRALGETSARTSIRELGGKGKVSEREVTRAVASPREIMQMDADHLIVLPPDGKAARLRRASPEELGCR